jgi:hypothetical protein
MSLVIRCRSHATDCLVASRLAAGFFPVGAPVHTAIGRLIRERIERSFLERIPGHALFKSLTQQMAWASSENLWKPALAEIEDALALAFIIEELEDGRFTVFVSSVPDPSRGNRLHPHQGACTLIECFLHHGSQAGLSVRIGDKSARCIDECTRPLRTSICRAVFDILYRARCGSSGRAMKG